MKTGFTLIEIMVSLAILAGLITVLAFIYGNLVDMSVSERRKAEANTDINLCLTLLEKDIMMAGFATPNTTKVASLNGTSSDRLFLADGWEIMRDFTDNGCDDGIISNDFYGVISSVSEGGGGYSASLVQYAATETSVIVVNNLNIDGVGSIADDDFKQNSSLIIYSGQGPPEGYRIISVVSTASAISLQEGLCRNYSVGSSVVPALCYYIASFEDRNWLFRNDARVLPDVEDFQVQYGYDDDANGILMDNEWVNSLPNPYTPTMLMAIRANLGIISPETKVQKIGTYTVSVELRN